MKALWGLILGVLVWHLIWSASLVRSNGRPHRRGSAGGVRGSGPKTTTTKMKDWDWPGFDDDVSDRELRALQDGFLANCRAALYFVHRQGQAELGVTNPETVAEHVDDLVKLADQYSEQRGYSLREKLVLKVMILNHEVSERRKKDSPLFPLPKDVEEMRRFIREWQPPTRDQELQRWVREWREERGSFLEATVRLSDRNRRILTYLFDRFYLGQDKVAQLAQQLHYLQPALDIRRRTRSWYALYMHLKRAWAVLKDRDIIKHLLRAYRVIGSG